MFDDILLKLRGIKKRFPGVLALDGVEFDLRPGEVHALLGENGAGKSTLVKIITGVHQQDAGQIWFEGQLVRFTNPLMAQQHGIAAIYQEPTLFPDLSVAENIFMGHHPLQSLTRRIHWRQIYKEASNLLRPLGMSGEVHTRVRGLSVAKQQMVEIAKALSVKARVVIMDEPTSALTPHEVEHLFSIVRGLRETGTAVIFISHRLEDTFQLADRVTVLRDGHYIGTRDISQVTPEEIIQMMVGRTLKNLFPKEEVQKGELVLRVDGLSKEGSFYDVSFELHRGEILGLAGLVGAGRTEVACTIFGVERPDRGNIWLDGHQVHIHSPNEALKLGIAYLPEDKQLYGLVLPMDITQNVTLPILSQFAHLGWIDETAEWRTAQEFAEQLDVRAAGLWQKVSQLSGGNQQKVVLAKWIAARPRILILDEPTKGIDVGTKVEIHRLMSMLAAQGLGILMISSELPEVVGMSDRVVVMHEGRVTACFSREEATQERIMSAATASALNQEHSSPADTKRPSYDQGARR